MTRPPAPSTAMTVLFLLAGLASAATAGDWPCWRGDAAGTGAASDSPALLAAWPEDGPPLAWDRTDVPEGGYASPTVAGDRVIMYMAHNYAVPFPERTLTAKALERLGRPKTPLPPDVAAKVEAARTSDEREALDGKERDAWIDAWGEKHLTEAQREAHGRDVKDRLKRGRKALDLATLETLAEIADRTFPTQDALDAWFAEKGLDEDVQKAVAREIPTERKEAKDVVLCLALGDGRTLWQATFAGRPSGRASGTPCVAGDIAYATGSDGQVWALDLASGEKRWEAKVGGGDITTSPLAADGLVVVMAGHLRALDAATGEVRWEQPEVKGRHGSPVLWRPGAQAYVLANTEKDLCCVDLKTGAVAWRVPGGKWSTPAVAGNIAAVTTDRDDLGLVAYRLTPEAATQLWSVPVKTRGASPVMMGGHVYAVVDGRAVCVEAKTGKIAWNEAAPKVDVTSAVAADGKVVATVSGGKTTLLLAADPKAFSELGKDRLGVYRCTTPALADGRLVVHRKGGVACYDLRASRP